MHLLDYPIFPGEEASTDLAAMQAAIGCGLDSLLTQRQCGRVDDCRFIPFMMANFVVLHIASESPTSLPNENCIDADDFLSIEEHILGLKGCCDQTTTLVLPEWTNAGIPTEPYGE